MRLPLVLALCLSLVSAGCTLGGGQESSGVDKSEYDGQDGYALALTNVADASFEATLRVLGVGNEELAKIEATVGPGESVEKWFSLDQQGLFSARLSYVWEGSGRTASGQDERTFGSADCPKVTRLAWELRSSPETVGSAFLGATCVDDDSSA